MKEKMNKKKIFMIKGPVSFYYIWKYAVYFEFLKRFIVIPFGKTVQRIGF